MTSPQPRGRRDVLPRDVPGYAAAVAAGHVPRVPSAPPGLAVRPTARASFHRFVGVALGGVGALAIVSLLVRALPLPAAVLPVALGGGAVAAFLAARRAQARVGVAALAEFRHGYTTLVLDIGGFWFGEGPTTRSGEVRAAWDYRGLWHLDASTGRVIRPPEEGTDPPGMYPSPTRPGCLELWTGATWLGHAQPLGGSPGSPRQAGLGM